MTFTSLHFLVFFPVVVALHYALPHRYRWGVLLAASYYFYMSWRPEFALLLLASTVVVYGSALLMARTADPRPRRLYLLVTLGYSLGALIFFKYLGFLGDAVQTLFRQAGFGLTITLPEVMLPVGISFYTFQSLSYTIDVYRKRRPPETHLGRFALYLAFFPLLLAGPIERASHLLPQFVTRREFDPQRVTEGLTRMAWGYYKKVVIADRLAIYVSTVYDNPTQYTGVPLILASYFFLWQLYCDFSGYSDIAIGAAKVLGIELVENFRRPFFAQSIAEFWRRWHLSLTNWFRDYVYIPLARRRRFRAHPSLDFFILFVLIGLWHGAQWTFVLFGVLHGFLMALDLWTQGTRFRRVSLDWLGRYPRAAPMLKWLVTFHLLVFSTIFFRANSLSDALYIVSHLFQGLEIMLPSRVALGDYEFTVAIVAIGVLELVHLLEERGLPKGYLASRPLWQRWSLYYALVFAVAIFGQFGLTDFIYFQF